VTNESVPKCSTQNSFVTLSLAPFIYLFRILDSLFLAMDEVDREHLTKQKAMPPFITLKQFMD